MGEEKSNVVITEEGALSVKKLTFWEAAMIIVGGKYRSRYFRTGLFLPGRPDGLSC